MTGTTLEAPIGAFAGAITWADVPPDVQGFARLLLLDTVGALLGGLRYPQVRALAAAVQEAEPCGRDDVPFARLMVLGTAATWLDADSGGSFHPQGHRLPPVPTAHPAPHVLPVLLHAAAAGTVPDDRLLEVFTVATEVGLRAGVSSSLRPGLHPHGVHGPGATGLAAALLRGVSAEELGAAFVLGSALPLAATLDVPVRGGTVRNAWTGLGAYYGASAAQQVAAGVRITDEVYRALFDSAVATDFSTEELLDGLGHRWELLNSYLKPYACARWIHPTLDAASAALTGAGAVAPDSVEAIEVRTFAFAASLSTTDIGSDMQARFSLPYSLAALIADGELHAGSFLPDGLARPAVTQLAARIRVVEDPEMSATLPRERPAQVVVRLQDGRVLTGQVRNARGNPSSALTRDEVVSKFRSNAGSLVASELVDELITSVLDRPRPGGTVLARLAQAVLADLAL